MDRPFKPLAGIRVVDLTRLLPGPLATLLLSDLGAEVIKVEEPTGEPARRFPPLIGDTSAMFHYLNRGKRFVTLDLREREDRRRLALLLEHADCLVEGFRPDVLARLGLDPEALAQQGLVVARLSGFGQHGPWRDRPGHDMQYLALTGILHGQFLPLPAQFADVGASLLLVSAILAALMERSHKGNGRVLDVPILDAALMFASPAHARDAAGDDPSPGIGILEGGFPLYGLFESGDGRKVALAALEPRSLEALERAFGTTDPDTIRQKIASVPLSALERDGVLPEALEPVLTLAEARHNKAVTSRALFYPMRCEAGIFMLPVTPFTSPEDVPEGPWVGPPGRDNELVFSRYV